MSSPSYSTWVIFKEDYTDGQITLSKGTLRAAVHHTDNPGIFMGMPGKPSPYKVWFDIYGEDVEDGYYAPIGTRTLVNGVPERFVQHLWDKKKFLLERRKRKIQLLLKKNILVLDGSQ